LWNEFRNERCPVVSVFGSAGSGVGEPFQFLEVERGLLAGEGSGGGVGEPRVADHPVDLQVRR
jgi:hypothetical protein